MEHIRLFLSQMNFRLKILLTLRKISLNIKHNRSLLTIDIYYYIITTEPFVFEAIFTHMYLLCNLSIMRNGNYASRVLCVVDLMRNGFMLAGIMRNGIMRNGA